MTTTMDHDTPPPSKQQVWFATADALVAFATEQGRLPNQGEGSLGVWLKNQRQAAHGTGKRTWNAERQAYLDERLPGWAQYASRPSSAGNESRARQNADRAWRQRADAVIAFYEMYGRLPRERRGTREAQLGRWLVTQRRARRGAKSGCVWTPERAAYLDQHLPRWGDAMRVAWHENLDATVAFVAEHGRFPRRLGARSAETREENRLHSWLVRERKVQSVGYRQAGREQRRALLDARLPGWAEGNAPLTPKVRFDRWTAKADELIAFTRVHGRLPSRARTQGDDERRLAEWVMNQRQAAKGLGSGSDWDGRREEYLREGLPTGFNPWDAQKPYLPKRDS
jgi:hypothetical protein